MKKYSLIIFSFVLLIACNSSTDTNTTTEEVPAIDSADLNPKSGVRGELTPEEQMEMLILTVDETLDSIDAAYSYIRQSSSKLSLSLDERQQVNLALQQINDARDLIILEAQEDMLEKLQQKTTAFKTMVSGMKTKTNKLADISKSLTRLSDMLQKATDAIVSAASSGIIKPRTVAN